MEKTQNTGLEYLPYKFTGQIKDEETGNYYIGARYLSPKYSRWLSCDPALGDYIPGIGKATSEEAGKLPGMGGIFNIFNSNLYHYAGNNPVKMKDADGNESSFFMTPQDIFGFIQKNDPAAQTLTVAAKAASGDSQAQNILAQASVESAKDMTATGLEVTAFTAGYISELTGDLAIEAIIVQPEVAGALGTASEISSGVEVGARGLKAALTKEPKDISKAKKTGIKNFSSFIFGRLAGFLSKKLGNEASNLIGSSVSKIDEKIIDKKLNSKNEGEQ